MKTLIIIFTCFLFSCSSNQQKRNYSLYDYIKQIYVEPSSQKLKLLENQQREINAEIQVLKLWPLYLKTFKLHNMAVRTNDKIKIEETHELLEKIKNKFVQLTSKDFPDIETEYKEKTKS